jgi:hypothetical protein
MPSEAATEIHVLPEWTSRHPSGLGKELTMPQAQGKLVYNPKATPRELAARLKREGAMPLNARFYRKLRGLQKRKLVGTGLPGPEPYVDAVEAPLVEEAERILPTF